MKRFNLLVYNKVLNTIDSCKNEEHFDITNVFIELYMKMYNNDKCSNFLKNYLVKKRLELNKLKKL